MKRSYWASFSDAQLAATAGELIGKLIVGVLDDAAFVSYIASQVRDELLSRRAARTRLSERAS